MKTILKLTSLCGFMFIVFSCAGSGAVQKAGQPKAEPVIAELAIPEPVKAEKAAPEPVKAAPVVAGPAKTGGAAHSESLTLDAAISECASYFTGRLPADAKVAIVPIDAPTERLSDYIFEEMWSCFEDSQKFIMVDRRNLERIEHEIIHQLESGRVDDDMILSVTKQYGAEILVYGQIVPVGREYRMSVYATDVEKATSNQRAFTVRPDNRLSALLRTFLDDEVERAVSIMADGVNRKTIITVGRICYADTQTVSSLSSWLKSSIIANVQNHRDKFQVASDDEKAQFTLLTRGFTEDIQSGKNPIQAVVTGNYLPLDSGAEVLLHLVSTGGNKVVLASAQLFIPVQELDRRKLSLLPEKDNEEISKTEFEAKHEVVDPYEGADNEWKFTICPDALDGIYYDGDFMSLHIYSSEDCYFRVVHVDVDGNIQVIYPVSSRDNNFIKAGQTRSIPDNTLYLMRQPFGEEIILAAAYDEPFAYSLSTAALLSEEAISRSFTVEGDRDEMTPSVTAKFSYTILPK